MLSSISFQNEVIWEPVPWVFSIELCVPDVWKSPLRDTPMSWFYCSKPQTEVGKVPTDSFGFQADHSQP